MLIGVGGPSLALPMPQGRARANAEVGASQNISGRQSGWHRDRTLNIARGASIIKFRFQEGQCCSARVRVRHGEGWHGGRYVFYL